MIPCLSQLLEAVQAGQPELASLQEPLLLLVSQVIFLAIFLAIFTPVTKNNDLFDMTEFFVSIDGFLF